MKPAVLVTGGAGYIGSHMTYGLIDRGYRVVVLDDLSTGSHSLVSSQAEFILGNVGDASLVRETLRARNIEIVIHFAGSIAATDSVFDPLKYYSNNVGATQALLESCVAEGVDKFVFSSTAAVYGINGHPYLHEDIPPAPISPYGRSKLVSEWLLRDVAAAHPLRFVALRYFNVAGADHSYRTGQPASNAAHLIKRTCQAALGHAPNVTIYGTDFDTPDGTGVRDYIHVSDLVSAHILAIDALRGGISSDVFNCGYGQGVSVREIIAAVQQVSGKEIATLEAPRRPGDPERVVADTTKIKKTLGWAQYHGNIQEIVRSALEWERKLTRTASPAYASAE